MEILLWIALAGIGLLLLLLPGANYTTPAQPPVIVVSSPVPANQGFGCLLTLFAILVILLIIASAGV
jgi:hypothetical protein